MKQNRIVPLECARGIASIIVVFHHSLLAFNPALKDFVWNGGLEWTPVYFLVNGTAAVTFFFVLSGFVLTFGLFRNPSFEVLTAAVIKRLPRLLIPVAASVFLGLLVLEFSGDQYQTASIYSGSQWLRDFGNASLPKNFTPSVLDAARQSFLVFFHSNKYYYNSNLWTMHNELFGSMLVFGIVFLFGFGRLRSNTVMTLLHAGLAVTFSVFCPAFVPFVAGSFLAYRVAGSGGRLEVSTPLTWGLLAGAVIGFASDWWPANTLASMFVVLSLVGNRAVAVHLSGRIGAFLGVLSFPLYLVHTLVILSVSSFVFTKLILAGWPMPVASSVTLMVTLFISFLVCVPFSVLDSHWVPWLNNKVRTFVKTMAKAYLERKAGQSLGHGGTTPE